MSTVEKERLCNSEVEAFFNHNIVRYDKLIDGKIRRAMYKSNLAARTSTVKD